MSKYLQPLLESGSGPVCWIEPNGYATRAYAGGNPDWATQAQPVASTLAQANGALNSQVLSIDLAPLLFGQDAEGDDPLDRVEQLLGSDRAGQRALPIVQAVEHTLADRVDLMLRLPSPAALLHHCGAEGALSFDDLDDAAAALAAVIREFSASRVAGLVLATDVDDDGGGDEMQVLAPVLGVARHYRWLTALRVDGRLSAQAAAAAGTDFLLLPAAPPADFARGWTVGDVRLGGGLSGAFWAGEDFPGGADGALYYGDAPAEVAPEQILARLRQLR